MPFGVKISVAIDGSGDDAGFRTEYDLSYHNLSYPALQELQHKLSDSLLEMGDQKIKPAGKK